MEAEAKERKRAAEAADLCSRIETRAAEAEDAARVSQIVIAQLKEQLLEDGEVYNHI